MLVAFVFGLLGGLIAQTSAASCPAGWDQGDFYGGDRYCYKAVDLTGLTKQARQSAVTSNYCKKFDARAYPASIHSRDEDVWVRRYGNQVGIGLYVRQCATWSKENYKWRDHTPLDYTNWWFKQPDNNGGNERHVVARLTDGSGWEDVCAGDGRDYKKLACKIDLEQELDLESM
uniref:C-type lectin domain-containing protein n=1 Tax=Panagrellus redivivus TaxID=6233 RepID=A0A7E4ZWU9_PANRE